MNYSKGIYSNNKWLNDKYNNEGLSLRQIALICRTDFKTIDYWVKKFNFKRHLVGDHRAHKSHHWKGGIKYSRNYRLIYDKHGGYKSEHRFVAEKILGRKLLSSEIIHHIDKNQLNNSPDNLYLFSSQSAHKKYHRAWDAGEVSILQSNLTKSE